MSLLKYAPLFLLCNGYWLLDNKQMFENKWYYKRYTTEHMKSGHLLEFPLNQATPLLLISCLAILIIAVQSIIPVEWM